MRLCPAHKRMKMTHDKKILITSFFCAPMRFQVRNSSLSKTFILFLKIVRLCAAHKRMKITHDKKIWITSFFSAPMRFQVQSFNSLKNFSLNCQNCSPRMKMTHDKKNQDHIFFLCAYAFSSSKIHLSQKIFFSKP